MLGETINCAIMNIGVCHSPIISWYIPGLYLYFIIEKDLCIVDGSHHF